MGTQAVFSLFLQLPGGEGALDQHTSAQTLGVLAAKLHQKHVPSRMTSTSLALCMGPNLLSPPQEDRIPVVQAGDGEDDIYQLTTAFQA